MDSLNKPKIESVTVDRSLHQGQPVFVLQNSMKLTEMAIALPEALGPLALLCDGEHTLLEIETRLAHEFGIRLQTDDIIGLLNQFDEALLLAGPRVREAKAAAITTYRSAPYRPPALAGGSYPADPDELRARLQQYIDETPSPPQQSSGRAIISPHIDYQRGGHVYAQVWASAAEAIKAAELVIIFGTDHSGGPGKLTLTRQHYASPLGVMPTDLDLVDRLAAVLGEDAAFDEELHHRDEWSIELDLVWLQYFRGDQPCPIVPILCGSFSKFMTGEANIDEASVFKSFVNVLRQEMKQRKTVIVASGDLAHMGPAFDGEPMDDSAFAKMQTDDAALMAALSRGDANIFLEFMKGQYQRNVCGLSPFYFTLDVLEESSGQTIAYDRCPADYNNTSFVSICGTVLT